MITEESATKIRSLISEKILNFLPIPCKFREHGCYEESAKEEIESHEKECEFRLVQCPDLICHQRIVFSNLIDICLSNTRTRMTRILDGNNALLLECTTNILAMKMTSFGDLII